MLFYVASPMRHLSLRTRENGPGGSGQDTGQKQILHFLVKWPNIQTSQ